MRLIRSKANFFILAVCVLWLSLAGRQAAQAPAMSVTPADPTISIGQTQQFTANGAIAPIGVSAGGEYTCVRLPDGTARCAGRNQFGQHGNGTVNDSTALDAVTTLTNATQVVAGDEFACALLEDRTARCWGLGESGQRGDGSFDTFALDPVAVSGLTGAVALAAGYGHTCALLVDGTMRCWGGNAEGELGNGTTATPGTARPVIVSGVAGATAIATGAYHTCAVLSGGTVTCWGRNGQGQLGDGTHTGSSTPVQVYGISSAIAVTGGGGHSCALLADGTVRCWGENSDGQLGDGTTLSKSYPIAVTGITGAVAVSGGWQHTCAVLVDHTVRCWGANEFGQLGDGTNTNALTSVQVSGISGAVGVTAGWWHHSCALVAGGTVRCWGVNEWGQLGNGTTTSSTTPVTMTGTGVTWTSNNTAVATIDATGRATGVSAGITTITATDTSGATASTTLTVRDRVTLSVLAAGAGNGNVTSMPSGINCGTDCSESYDSDTTVTLTASAASNSNFVGWGGCDTVSGTTCTVTMSAARVVTAIFDLKRFTLTVAKAGLARDSGNDVLPRPHDVIRPETAHVLVERHRICRRGERSSCRGERAARSDSREHAHSDD